VRPVSTSRLLEIDVGDMGALQRDFRPNRGGNFLPRFEHDDSRSAMRCPARVAHEPDRAYAIAPSAHSVLAPGLNQHRDRLPAVSRLLAQFRRAELEGEQAELLRRALGRVKRTWP
jgi:hypothetical protein